MTLVLTKITPDGAVMSADTALTESYDNYARYLLGVSKLFPHQASGSCIGTWGGAVIPNPMRSQYPIAIEFILRQFLSQAGTIRYGEQLANRLAEWLSENFTSARQVIG